MIRPVAKGSDIEVSSPSSFIESIKKAFDVFPVILNESHIPTLRGMASVRGHNKNEYDILLEYIEKFGTIEIYAEY